MEASESARAEGKPALAVAEAEAAWALVAEAEDAPAGLVAWTALALSEASMGAGRHEGREEALERALVAVQSPDSDAHPSYVSALHEALANWRVGIGDLERASAHAEAALASRAEVEGPGAPGQAITMHLLAGIRLKQGHPAEALRLAREALSIVEQDDTGTFGPLDRAQALAGLAYMEQNGGSPLRAIEASEQALFLLEEHLPADHPALASPLNNLGLLYRQVGRFADGVAALERALAIREATEGIDPVALSITRANLASELLEDGRPDAALRRYRQAAGDIEAVHGPSHPDAIGIRLSEANTLLALGALGEALALTEDLVARSGQVLGSAHPTTIFGHLVLASILEDLGDTGRARVLAEAAHEALLQGVSPEHPHRTRSLATLARLHREREDPEAALALVREATAHLESTAGRNRQWWALRTSEANLLLELGRVEDAGLRIDELTGAASSTLDRLQVDLLRTRLLLARGDIAAAAEGLAAIDAHPSPDLELSLHRLRAHLHWVQNEPEVALPELGAALRLVERLHLQTAERLSTRQRSEQRLASRRQLDAFLTLAGPTESLDAVLRWKQASLTDLSATSGRDPEQAALQERRLALLRQISAWEQREAPAERRDEALLALGEELDHTERALVHRSGIRPAPVDTAAVCAALAEDEALVELVRYAPWQPGTIAPGWQVDAFVLRGGPDCRARRVGLGAAEALAMVTTSYLDQVQAGLGEAAVLRRGTRLRRQLWDPVASLVGTARHVWWVPEDIVASAPLSALPLDDGRLWIEQRSVSTLTSAVELTLPRATSAGQGAVVLGGVDFGQGDTWTPLPGTSAERNTIARILRRHLAGPVDELGGEEATEQALVASARGSRVVHLATHGWYATPEPLARTSSGVRSARLVHSFAGDLPVALAGRSGLALAGANLPTDDLARDGRWIEAEVAAVDLSAAQLVVLSACETGLGVSRRGEGVLGLGRALLAAGARSTLLTLWQVPDTDTAEVMEGFYRRLTRGRGTSPADALRTAQLAHLHAQREQTGESLPWTWAAFQLSGRGARTRLTRRASPHAGS